MNKYLLARLVSLFSSAVWADGGAVTPLLPHQKPRQLLGLSR